MALIKDYLPAFIKSHRDRFAPHDWPQYGTEEWQAMQHMWFIAFIERRVTKVEAQTASIRLGMTPPRFRNDHLPALLAEVAAIRAANQVVLDVPEERSQAEFISRDCPHCFGSGLTTIYRREYAGAAMVEIEGRDGEVRQVLARCAAHCVCPMGRWIRSRTKDAGVLARTPRLADVLEGRSEWLTRNPTTPDLPDGCCDDMTFSELWQVIQRPGQGPTHVEPVVVAAYEREPGDDG